MNIHARHVSRKAFGILTAALTTYALHTYDHHGVDGFLPAPAAIPYASIMSSHGSAHDFARQLNAAHTDVMTDAHLRPAGPVIPNVSDPSVVFLMKISSETYTATGTIVNGDLGMNRILTAGHFDQTESPALRSEKILAFSGEGEALAILVPVVSTRQNRGHDIAFGVMNDLAVFEPVAFFSETAEAEWNARGVDIAQDQPAHPLFLSSAPDDIIFNQGTSGGSLRNADGDIVGVAVRSFFDDDFKRSAPAREHDLDFLKKIQMKDTQQDFEFETTMIMAAKGYAGREQDLNNTGLAAPVLHPDILNSLGVSGVHANADVPAFVATLSAFPGSVAVSSTIFASPMERYDAENLIRMKDVIHYDNLSASALAR